MALFCNERANRQQRRHHDEAGINPKPENRSTKQIQRTKAEMTKATLAWEVSDIGPLGI
jgi:hypothetical protein